MKIYSICWIKRLFKIFQKGIWRQIFVHFLHLNVFSIGSTFSQSHIILIFSCHISTHCYSCLFTTDLFLPRCPQSPLPLAVSLEITAIATGQPFRKAAHFKCIAECKTNDISLQASLEKDRERVGERQRGRGRESKSWPWLSQNAAQWASPQLVVPARQHDAAQLSKFLQHATPATPRLWLWLCDWRCMHHAVQRLKYISSGASSCLVKPRKVLRKICNQSGPQTVHTASQRHGEAGVPSAEIHLVAVSMQDQTARRPLQAGALQTLLLSL